MALEAAQGALDRIHGAANARVAQIVGGMGGIEGAETGSGGGWSKSQLVQLYERVGMPNPNLMAAIALAESSGVPNAFGPPSGRGHLQIEWKVWADTMRKAGLTNPDDPWQNAQMAKIVLGRQGLGAWVAYNRGRHLPYMQSGGMAGMAAGGLAGQFGRTLKKVRTGKSPKIRKTAVDKLLGPDQEGRAARQAQQTLGDASKNAAVFGEMADRASAITTDDVNGNPIGRRW